MTITIIGGGIIGLTTAFELTERGENVHLIDAETSDYGTAADGHRDLPAASHYAGGMLAPIAEVQFQQDALFPLMTASADAYPSLMAGSAAPPTCPPATTPPARSSSLPTAPTPSTCNAPAPTTGT